MGIFGSREDKETYELIKEEYRETKQKIAEARAEISSSIDEASSKDRPKFEYLVLEDIDQARLNEVGFLGWELVNFASYTVGFGVGGNTAMKVHLSYVFKRPIEHLPARAQELAEWLNDLLSHKAELIAEIEARGDRAE